MKLTELWSYLACLGLMGFGVVSAGCPHHHQVVVPAPSGPLISYTHTFELTWSYDELYALRSLTVRHPGEIEVLDSGQIETLTLLLTTEIQAENHVALADGFENAISAASVLDSDSPRVTIPPQNCVEAPNQLTGICVRKLIVMVPAIKHLPMDLAWQGDARIDGLQSSQLTLHIPATGTTRLVATTADVTITPGSAGPASTILVDRLQGSFSARLTGVNTMLLSAISGRVDLDLDQHERSTVRLDGSTITEFPYHSQ